MNRALLYCASGDSLYAGAFLLLLAVALPVPRPGLPLRLRSLWVWFALAMMVMACPPFPWTVDAIFLGVLAVWFFVTDQGAKRSRRFRAVTTALFVVLLLVLPAIECSHRAMPRISGVPSDHLTVIGDSLSSGVDPHVTPWPAVMQQTTGVRVKNLARPGATTIAALEMATDLTPADQVVLIEIGGNDLLTGLPSGEFGRALEKVLAEIAAPGRTTVMFELPLLPHRIAYGQIQRHLAKKYNVPLIPKRYLINVLSGADATSDGLHLSEVGARRMAAVVAQALSPVLKGSPTPSPGN